MFALSSLLRTLPPAATSPLHAALSVSSRHPAACSWLRAVATAWKGDGEALMKAISRAAADSAEAEAEAEAAAEDAEAMMRLSIQRWAGRGCGVG